MKKNKWRHKRHINNKYIETYYTYVVPMSLKLTDIYLSVTNCNISFPLQKYLDIILVIWF